MSTHTRPGEVDATPTPRRPPEIVVDTTPRTAVPMVAWFGAIAHGIERLNSGPGSECLGSQNFVQHPAAVDLHQPPVGRNCRGTSSSGIGGLALLPCTPVLGTVGALRPWFPSTLANGPVELLGPVELGDYTRTVAVVVVLALAFLTIGVRRLAAREF